MKQKVESMVLGFLGGAVVAAGLWGAARGLAGLAYDQRNDRIVLLWLLVTAVVFLTVVQMSEQGWIAVLLAVAVCAMPMLRLHVLHQEAFHDRGRVEPAVLTAEYEQGSMDGSSYSYDLKVPGATAVGELNTGAQRLRVGHTVTVTVDPLGEVAPALGRRTGAPTVTRALETGAEVTVVLMTVGFGAWRGLRRPVVGEP
jgi:hypothetical protein